MHTQPQDYNCWSCKSELKLHMNSTYAIIIVKEREMKNLPGRCKSRMMAMKAWGCLPKRNSLLCFFSSFTFLGRLFFLCICLLVFLCCSSCSLAFCSVCLFFFVFLSVRSLWFSPLVCLYYLRSLGLPSPLVSSVRPCWMLPLCCSPLSVRHGRPARWEQKLLRPTFTLRVIVWVGILAAWSMIFLVVFPVDPVFRMKR